MTKEQMKEFTYRISQANPTELVVVTYDMLLADVKNALAAYEKKDAEEYENSLDHGSRVINELMNSLDMTNALAGNLRAIYIYVQRELIGARFSGDAMRAKVAAGFIERLRDSFRTISALDTSGPVMENTQQVYAGLTYGRAGLNESEYGTIGERRGFLA